MVAVAIPGVIEFSEPELWAVGAALVMMLMDILSGFVGAVVRGDVSSTKMREGIGHKALLIIVIIAAVLVQTFSLHIGDMGWSFPLIVPCCVYIIVMEVTSVMENVKSAYPGLDGTPLMQLFDRVDDVTNGNGGDDE